MLVPRSAPPIRRPFLYRFADGALRLLGSSPVPALEPGASWSRDGKLIASQPIEPCKKRQRMVWRCYRGSDRILVRHADGSHPRVVARARFLNVDSWTPDDRVLVTSGHTYVAVDVQTGRRSVPLAPWRVTARFGLRHVWLSAPRWVRSDSSPLLRSSRCSPGRLWDTGLRTRRAASLLRMSFSSSILRRRDRDRCS